MKFWKRVMAAMTAGLLCIGIAPVVQTAQPEMEITANAETYLGGLLSYSVLDDGTVAITDCDTSVTEVEIPAEIDGMAVTSIGGEAFYDCRKLTSITIPDGVIYIGGSAFDDCINLTSVTIPDSVTSIGTFAFSGCRSLASITIPDSVTSIGDIAFSFCTSLTEIVIPDSVTEIGCGMFRNCSALQSVTLPNQITELPSFDTVGFFQDCSSLSEIVIPESVTCIGKNAFLGTALLENQTGVKYADTWIVDCDEDVTVAEVKSGTKGIADNAFADCAALTTVTIPITVTNIGSSAFEVLTDVYYNGSEASWNAIRMGVNNVPLWNANIYCNLTYRILEDGTAEVVSCVKDATQVTIPETAYGVPVTSIAESAFADCNLLEQVVIPDGITAIQFGTFSNCTRLAEVTIPDSVISIDASAFSACTSLSDVYYTGTMAQWQTIAIAEEGNESLSYATIHCSDGDIAPKIRLGDVDDNSTTDPNDAYLCLLAYAKLSVGSDSGLTVAQMRAADVDGDGSITANDAYYILLYYAKQSVGQDVTWEEIL